MPKSELTKADIAKIIAKKYEISERKALAIQEDIFQAILNNLKEEGDRITLRNFGTFKKVKTTRSATNPKTGEKLEVKPRLIIKFKGAKVTKEIVEE